MAEVGLEALPWHQLRYQHTQAIRQRLVETVSERTGKPLSPASVNKALAALRGVLRESWRLGLMSAEDLARAADLDPVRGSRPLRGRALEPHEVAALFHAGMRDASPAGPRDAVVLALGLAVGLRRAEIAGLDLGDVDLERGVVRVHGKGNKVREVPIKGGTLEAIRAWLSCRGGEPGPLWYARSERAAGSNSGGSRLRRSCGCARSAGARRGSRALQRTTCEGPYVSTLLDQGVALSLASDLVSVAG